MFTKTTRPVVVVACVRNVLFRTFGSTATSNQINKSEPAKLERAEGIFPGFGSSQSYEYKKIEQKLPEFRPQYLDAQATTPLDPRVLDAMMPYLGEAYGNPHSRSHAFGWESETGVENARGQVRCYSEFVSFRVK